MFYFMFMFGTVTNIISIGHCSTSCLSMGFAPLGFCILTYEIYTKSLSTFKTLYFNYLKNRQQFTCCVC